MIDRSDVVKLIVFDWAGTTVDFGCFAPVAAFIGAFAGKGVQITPHEARGPMGLHKQDHIRTLLQDDSIAARWLDANGAAWSEEDVKEIYHSFMPQQVEEAKKYTDVIPGVVEAVKQLQSQGIKIGSTTGYPRVVAEPVLASAAEQGYQPDEAVCADDVSAARPAPWMMYRNMEQLGVYPPHYVVKVGDTVPDIGEGLNAGAWSVGVTDSSSEIGMTYEEWNALPAEQQQADRQKVAEKLTAAGAHFVIPTVAELPELVVSINEKLANGERP